MKPVNYLDQSLYTGIQTRHIMALTGHRRYSQDRPKREMFEALMPVASSSSLTHDIYGYLRRYLFPKKEQLWTYTMLIIVLKLPL